MKAATKMLEAMTNGRAFKLIDVDDLGDGKLNVEKLAQFVRVVSETSPILGEATFVKMKSWEKQIDRIEMIDGILEPGRDNNGVKRTVTNDANVDINTNSLNAKELIARVKIDYDTLEDNIEQADFENSVIELFGNGASRDMEKVWMYMDTNVAWGSDRVSRCLSMGNGWLKQAANKIYGVGDDKDFDPLADEYPINLFKALIGAIPKKYLADRTNFRLYVPWDVEDAYRDILAARGTVLGDNALIGNEPVTYKKIPVVSVPAFDDDNYTAKVGVPAMLSKPANMYWGLWRQIMVENEKDIDNRNIKNVLSMRGDATYEDENAAVTAWINKENPSG